MNLSFERRHSAGHRLTAMGSSKVDNSGQNYAAISNAMLSREQLTWAQQLHAESAPQRAEAEARAREVSELQMAQTRQQMGITQQAADDYQRLYRPLEQGIVAEAANYDTPERRAAASAEAVASVEQQISAQRSATMREQERAGVSPESGKTAALQAGMDVETAKAKAGAGNLASRQVETVGYARKMDAANLGRNIASAQGTSASLALNSGNSAVQNSSNVLAARNNGSAQVQSAYGTAMNGMAQSGQMFGNIAQQQQSANNANAAATGTAVAGVAAAAGAAYSSGALAAAFVFL